MSITQLTAAARKRMMSEICPKLSGAKERNQETETIAKIWHLSLKTPDERQAAATGGDVAGFVFLGDNAKYAVASCITSVPMITKAMAHYGCQWGDDISQTETGYFPKKHAHGSVLVPMLRASAEACKLTYDPHDLSVAYSLTATTTRSTDTGFKWPGRKTCKYYFADLAAGQKIIDSVNN